MLCIGIDLGGTKTEAIALNAAGKVLQRVRLPTVRDNYGATLTTIHQLVAQIEEQLNETGTVGVGIPGTVVAATGLVKNANSTWLNGKPLVRDLSSTLHREVRCSNDANCFAVSEATDGAGAKAGVVFGAILGTGCGGGVVIRGAVHNGPNGLAGEWGHIPLPWPEPTEWPGPACYCGRFGCLETWISGTGFERDFAQYAGKVLRAREIVLAMRGGDTQAVAAFRRLQSRIARGLAVVTDLLDPDIIVLGGGLSNVEELYTGELEQLVAQHTFGGGTATTIVRNRHGDSSGVRGAAWLWPPGDGNGAASSLDEGDATPGRD